MDIKKKKYIEERQFNFGNMIAHILDFGLIRILHLNKELLFNHITYFYNKIVNVNNIYIVICYRFQIFRSKL